MLSHEFIAELGAYVRQLEQEIRTHPKLTHADEADALEYLDKAIVAMIAVRMKLGRELRQK